MASGSVDSASHMALVNQCLKACSSDGSAKSLPKCRTKIAPKSKGVTFESKRQLQDRFNRGGFVERALGEGYQCCLRDAYETQFDDEPGQIEVLLIGWSEPSGQLRFYAQCMRRKDGVFATGTLLDPKLLLDDDGHRYKLDQ